MIPTTELPSGEAVPVLGQGTWGMGEDRRRRKQEVAALQQGLDLGMTLIDTAEMYGDGGAEEIVGEAVGERRDEVFIVTKFYPQNASPTRMVAACDRSLKRLRVEYIDLYLLHWRGSIPLHQTLDGFHTLRDSHKIRHWGVSNFDLSDMKELVSLPGGSRVATDQVLYNLQNRGMEWDVLPWCHEHNIPIMAYSPLGQTRLLKNRRLKAIAERAQATPAQIALAWVLIHRGIIAIPKMSQLDHLRENYGALELRLDKTDLEELDQAFPPPKGPAPLEIL
jgi:diketogulonate reductase-like aldo/keto reductase